MPWRSNYKQASFRGVPFHALEIEDTFGRRLVVNEYPQLETPYVEDLGRAYDQYSVEGYVIGPDYDIQLQALIRACRDQSGPGRLVHSYYGEKTVRCASLRTRQSMKEGGIARFYISFFEEGENNYPSKITNPASEVNVKSGGMISAVQDAFSKVYKVAGYVGYVQDSAVAQVREFSDYMAALSAPVSDALDASFSFAVTLQKLKSDAVSLVNRPGDLAQRASNILSLIKSTFISSEKVLSKIIEDYSPTEHVNYLAETPSRKQQKVNNDQFAALVRQVSLSERAIVAVATEYPTYQDAYAAREAILEQIDVEETTAVVDDTVYASAVTLATEVFNSIPLPSQRLPDLRKIVMAKSLPAVVIAYRLYEDAGRESEIVSRNSVRHPGFMPGGKPIEVIVDAA